MKENILRQTFGFPLHSYERVWKMLQKGHEKVIRWEEYWKNNPNLLRQTNLHHVGSLMPTAHFVVAHLRAENPTMDVELILDTALCHEHGEGIIGKDALYHNKTDAGDLEETLAFRRFNVGDSYYRNRMMKAFLLQYATKKENGFGGHDKIVTELQVLREKNSFEAAVFNAIEKLDYFWYAKMGYEECADVVILTHTLRNQFERLEYYSSNIRGFDRFWDEETSKTASSFLEKYQDIPGAHDIGEAYKYSCHKGYMII